jgi:hypothetical protein
MIHINKYVANNFLLMITDRSSLASSKEKFNLSVLVYVLYTYLCSGPYKLLCH